MQVIPRPEAPPSRKLPVGTKLLGADDVRASLSADSQHVYFTMQPDDRKYAFMVRLEYELVQYLLGLVVLCLLAVYL